MLRVVTAQGDPELVITAYFDRTRPCERESITRRMRSIFNLTDRRIEESEEVAEGIVVDYDADGRIVSIEVLDASKRTGDPAALKQFSFEAPKLELK